MARAPKPGTTRPTEAAGIVVVVDGVPHPFNVSEMSARDVGDLRRATGMSSKSLLIAAASDIDIDIVASLVWLSRRQNGEPKLAYEDVADVMTHDTALSFGGTAEPADPNSPEA